MPILTPIDASLPDLLGSRQYAPRTRTSAHVSAIVKSLCQAIDPGRFGKHTGYGTGMAPSVTADEATQNRWEIGLAFEDVLSQVLVDRTMDAMVGTDIDRYVRPGEYKDRRTGIIGTPDMKDVIDLAIEEWKATWMTCRPLIEQGEEGWWDPKYWHWWVQGKCYLHLTGYRILRIRALFINGSYTYKGGPEATGPQFRCVEARFTDAEVAENWEMCVNEARRLKWVK